MMVDVTQWSGSSIGTESTLHQLAPYIGKLKSKLVRQAVPNPTSMNPKRTKYQQKNDFIFKSS